MYIRKGSGADGARAQRVAEKALGKSLPSGAEVHHVDEDPTNNEPSNLVICESRSYHILLHQRTDALKACGHADWKRCRICGEYSDSENLESVGKGSFLHTKCRRQYQKERPVQNFCRYCKEQDLPENLQVDKATGRAYHRECAASYRQLLRAGLTKIFTVKKGTLKLKED